MVDFRPLLFTNALVIMLLVTAGFASIRQDVLMPPLADSPVHVSASLPDAKTEAVPLSAVSVESEPSITPVTTTASDIPEQPAQTIQEPPAVAPEEKPVTGMLVLRSNVSGDQVIINGQQYGATRLDLELHPGKYEIEITKPGYQPWTYDTSLKAGDHLTLVGNLTQYTRVDYQSGTWIGGVKTGDGTYSGTSGLRYEGHFVGGNFDGRGTAWFADGSRYEGDWRSGQFDGEGTLRNANDSHYTGQFQANQFSGQGTLTQANGDILTGQWQAGRQNGLGSLSTVDGMLYVGGFRNSRFHGEGALTYPDGRHYKGAFSNGEFHGEGSEVFSSGKKYQGQYINGKFHGQGLLLNPNGSSIEAAFRHGEPYGQVRLTTPAGEVFTARTSEPGVCFRDKSYRATQCPVLEGW